ncbi:MAG: mannitol dehydrogenase family protein [Methylobacteriaceae bacterium]|jgi:fructuronate reductase|nr:mannitol dehydrogenase family protein [Methylobacteriaceae bacterium]
MELTLAGLADAEQWQKAGFILPRYDVAAVRAEAVRAPQWLHFGPGNLFRAFPAQLLQELLDQGLMSGGVIVAEGHDYEIIDKIYTPHDNLCVLVTLRIDGAFEPVIIGGIAEARKLDAAHADFARLKEVFSAPTLRMASFTITEKGYNLVRGDGSMLPDVERDFAAGPEAPFSYLGKVTALLHARFLAGELPVSLVSMDNCSHNGDRLYDAVRRFAGEWSARGLVDAAFPAYVDNRDKVGFPWTMIDKITPRPDDGVAGRLKERGLEGMEVIVTAKKSWVAPFVNGEEIRYLVIEDWFPNGRLPLDKVGAVFTDRTTVDKVEKMKVCTCLNPLQTALAIFGCLLSYTGIAAEMQDDDLVRLLNIIGYDEGLPVVVNPGVIDPWKFIDETMEIRLPNPYIPDTPQRIVTDTSQKLRVRFGETIKAYRDRGMDLNTLRLTPLVLAAWCRYLLGVNDSGAAFEPSPDPLLAEVSAHVAGLRLGDTGPFHDALAPLLADERLFGVNLYDVGLGGIVETYFTQMMAGPGAVRATLHQAVKAGRAEG